jgi:hypothetical protein
VVESSTCRREYTVSRYGEVLCLPEQPESWRANPSLAPASGLLMYFTRLSTQPSHPYLFRQRRTTTSQWKTIVNAERREAPGEKLHPVVVRGQHRYGEPTLDM